MKWSVETPRKYCPRGTDDGEYYGQLECQKLCEADAGCVGIAWAQDQTNSKCILCTDNFLTDSLYYGFYRKPLGNNYVHTIC